MKNTNSLVSAHRHLYVREVNAVLDVTKTEVSVKLKSRHNCAVVLRLCRRCSEVGDSNRALYRYHIVCREIGNVCSYLSGCKSCLDVIAVYKLCSGEVDDSDSVLHHSDSLCINHILCVGSCGNVKCYIVSVLEYLLKGSSLVYVVVDVPSRVNAEVGVTAENAHSKVYSCVCNHSADSSKTNNAKLFAEKLNARELGLACLNSLCNALCSCESLSPLDSSHDVTGSKHERADSELLNSVSVSAGSVENYDSLL